MIVVDDDRPRASHPLLAAAALQRSTAGERRELHLELADLLATDGELRARHLALTTEGPDEEFAATIAAAAARASDRGAAPEAVILGEHALRLTPPDAPERATRVIALAEYLVVAGELERVESLLVPEFEALPAGAPESGPAA